MNFKTANLFLNNFSSRAISQPLYLFKKSKKFCKKVTSRPDFLGRFTGRSKKVGRPADRPSSTVRTLGSTQKYGSTRGLTQFSRFTHESTHGSAQILGSIRLGHWVGRPAWVDPGSTSNPKKIPIV